MDQVESVSRAVKLVHRPLHRQVALGGQVHGKDNGPPLAVAWSCHAGLFFDAAVRETALFTVTGSHQRQYALTSLSVWRGPQSDVQAWPGRRFRCWKRKRSTRGRSCRRGMLRLIGPQGVVTQWSPQLGGPRQLQGFPVQQHPCWLKTSSAAYWVSPKGKAPRPHDHASQGNWKLWNQIWNLVLCCVLRTG